MRAANTILVSVLVVAGALAAGPAGAEQRGSFSAEGPPGAWGCVESGETVTGQQAVTAEYAGTLVVQTAEFVGDWDVAILDADGEVAASGAFWEATLQSGVARTFLEVEAGDDVVVVACNYQSAQLTLEVSWWVEPGIAEPNPEGFDTIAPGRLPDLREELPVTVVLVGYDQDQVAPSELLAGLPDRARPRVRMPAFYGHDRPLGITYDYRYRVVRADADYVDAVADAFGRLADESALTAYQRLYNEQASNVRDIDFNLAIPAVEAELWLAEHPPSGVDTSLPTVFLLNFDGLDDFDHHVYVKEDEPDPDTGYPFGTLDRSAMIAWGGTPPANGADAHRVWFHDLSAGPDWRTGNWNVDDADIDGNGTPDRRLPPVWEYTEQGFADPDQLVTDLADVVRYVALDLLFTPSPLYPPALTPPDLPDEVSLEVDGYDMNPLGARVQQRLNGDLVRDAVDALLPDRTTRATVTLAELSAEHRNCLTGYYDLYGEVPGCYAEHPYPSFANLFVHHAKVREPSPPNSPYRAGGTLYAFDDALGFYMGCWAYAGDNWRNGVQSFIFAFMSDWCSDHGFTRIITHEYGHHFGLSHPHDGHDPETGEDFGPYGEYYFVWVGDESSTVMSYLDVEPDFSQFDLDNMSRWMTAAYLQVVNEVAGDLLAVDATDDVLARLHEADAVASRAARAFADHDYALALHLAQQTWGVVRDLAAERGLRVPASGEGWRLAERSGADLLPPAEFASVAVDRLADVGTGIPAMDLVPPGPIAGPRLDRPNVGPATRR